MVIACYYILILLSLLVESQYESSFVLIGTDMKNDEKEGHFALDTGVSSLKR